MSPEQFIARVGKQPLAPAYLFLGPEGYFRRVCREALIGRALGEGAGPDSLEQIDLEQSSLRNVLDNARSLSLFATQRLLWISSAELALPRRLTADSEDGEPDDGGLSDYLRNPTDGTTIVFECSRYDFGGDDRPKLERVQKYYAKVPVVVEFRALTPESSRFLAQELIKQYKVKISGAELAALLEAVAGDAIRLASEIEKIALFVGSDRPVTMADLRTIVPNAAQTTIFELVNALGKRDRAGALRSLDILVREGEYLPLALTFLGTQFRLALAAKEERITSAQQAQNLFNRIGVRIWRERAEQIISTAAAFKREHLVRAVELVYETDKKFRDGYRDDRLVLEGLVLSLTSESPAIH
jgi:DNA polymerase-3 subunit delta